MGTFSSLHYKELPSTFPIIEILASTETLVSLLCSGRVGTTPMLCSRGASDLIGGRIEPLDTVRVLSLAIVVLCQSLPIVLLPRETEQEKCTVRTFRPRDSGARA